MTINRANAIWRSGVNRWSPRGKRTQDQVLHALLQISLQHLEHAPYRSRQQWKGLRPGTLIGMGMWLAASLGLKFYVANFANYNVAYESMCAVIVLLLWFYLSSMAILAGAQVNAMLERDVGPQLRSVAEGCIAIASG